MTFWKTYKLDEVLDALIDYRGKTPKKTLSGIPLITAKIVKNGFIQKPNEFIAKEDYKGWMTRGIPKIGDVVLTVEAPLGEVAQIKTTNIALAQRIITLRGKKGILDNGFLKYFLQSDVGQNRLKERETGTTVTGIKQSELRLVEIDFPDFENQTRIASILSSLDNKIELNRQTNQTLEAIAQTLFKEMCMPNGVELPDGWRIGKLVEIYKTTSGGTPSREKIEYYEKGTISWVKSKELGSFYVIETEEQITETALKNSSAKILPENSILMAMYGATVAEISILGKPATCNQAICAIIPNSEYPYSFVYEFLKAKRDEIKSMAVGAAQQNISQVVIQGIEMVIPKQDVLFCFHRNVESIYLQIKTNIQESQTLTTLRDNLLPKLMKGEIEI